MYLEKKKLLLQRQGLATAVEEEEKISDLGGNIAFIWKNDPFCETVLIYVDVEKEGESCLESCWAVVVAFNNFRL